MNVLHNWGVLLVYKTVRFWLLLLSLMVVFINLIGQDDKNLLLFFTSPVSMFLEEYMNPDLPIGVHYLFHIGFWIFFGWLIDFLISRFKRST